MKLNEEEYTKLTDWKREPKQKDLQKDFELAQSAHSLFLTKLDEWRINLDGGSEITVRKGKSTVRPRLIRKNAEWKYPALEEPFLNTEDMFEIKPRTAEDASAALQNQILLNYFWATKINKVKLVGDIVRTVVDEGTVVVKTGWNTQTEMIDVMKEEPVYASPEESLILMEEAINSGSLDQATAQAMIQTGQAMQIGTKSVIVQEESIVENHPTYEVCDNTNIIIDPTCDGCIDDAQFIIHEYELDLNTFRRQEFKTDEEGNETGIYKNLDFINFNDENEEYDEYTNEKKATFVFADKARKKVKVYEYWGYWDIDGQDETTAIVATWVGDVMVRLEENPFPHGKLPFSAATYMPVKKEFHGQPDGELLRENQESIGKMTRAAHDITSTQAIGQTLINEQFFSSPSQWDAYKKGNDARFRADMDPRTAIFKANVEPVNKSVFDMINMQNSDAESLTGTKAFSGGVSGQALGSTATGIRSALDATSKRELSILRRLSTQLFQDMARKTVINTQAYSQEEEVIRITNSEFKVIRREDLAGEFDLKIAISTPERDNETAERLNMLMQTNAASMHPEMSKIIYSKIARLWKEPDLAEEMMNFEPQPDPAQEQLMQLQMQNATLENQKLQMEVAKLAKEIEEADSRISERNTRAEENITADITNKQAQTEERLARAELYRSQTDAVDQEFLDIQSGTKRQAEVDDMQFREDSSVEKEQRKQEADLNKQIIDIDAKMNQAQPTNYKGN